MNKRIIFLSFFVLLITFFFWQVSRYYFIGDDAYISFRYSLNLINGDGLVYNPGAGAAERVEGYTNFLWVILVALGMLFGFTPDVVASFLSISSGIILLYLIYKFTNKENESFLLTASLLLLLVLSRSFTAWCSSGLETMFFTLLVFAGNYFLFSNLLLSSLCFSLSVLTRPEGLLFAGLAGCFLIFKVYKQEVSVKQVFNWGVVIFLTALFQLVFRLVYYGYPLPNTFYAKVAGVWLEQGFNYFSLFNDYYKIVWFLPFLLFAFQKQLRVTVYFAIIILTYFAYIL